MVKIRFQKRKSSHHVHFLIQLHVVCTMATVPDTCWVRLAHCDINRCWITLCCHTNPVLFKSTDCNNCKYLLNWHFLLGSRYGSYLFWYQICWHLIKSNKVLMKTKAFWNIGNVSADTQRLFQHRSVSQCADPTQHVSSTRLNVYTTRNFMHKMYHFETVFVFSP